MDSFCSQCGRYKDIASKKMCEVCRKKRRERAADLEKRRKEKDQCTKCGKKLDRSGARCKSCLRKYRLRKTNPDYRCVECNKNIVQDPPERLYCDGCKLKINAIKKLKKTVILAKYGNKCDTCQGDDTDCLLLHQKGSCSLEIFTSGIDHDDVIKDDYPDDLVLECANCLFKRASSI
jgi:hypothetical protein